MATPRPCSNLSYFPDREFRGRVTYVYPNVDEKTRTARVRMEFHNPGYFLKPGMFAQVQVVSELEPSALLVPDMSILRSGEKNTVFVALDGGKHLESVRCRNKAGGADTTENIRHLFVMTGAVPATKWLDNCVALDDHGFIKTGPDISPEDLNTARWSLKRQPHLLETSLPGVFAIGDVRGGNIKRVASAVGEGSIAIAFVHQVLRE